MQSMVFQWFLVLLPSLSMVFDGFGPLVKRCDGFDGSSWSTEEVCSPRPCICKSFVFKFTLKKKHESLPSPTCLWTMEHHQLLQRHMRKSSLLLEDEVHTVSLSYNTGNREKKQCNIQRTCIPALPNLPPGYSCENLEKSLTLSSNTTACEPFVPCRGEFLPQFE